MSVDKDKNISIREAENGFIVTQTAETKDGDGLPAWKESTYIAGSALAAGEFVRKLLTGELPEDTPEQEEKP